MEYALLGAFIGLVGILAWQGVVTQIGARYTEFNTNVPMYWEPPWDPGS